MKKVILTITYATLLFFTASAQYSFPAKGLKNSKIPRTSNQLMNNANVFGTEGNVNIPISNNENIQRAGKNKTTGEENRVIAIHSMYYNGAQYEKSGDSTRLFYSGTRSLKDFTIMDVADYLMITQSYEYSHSTFPQYYSSGNEFSNVDSSLTFGLNAAGTEFEDLNGRVINTYAPNGNLIESLERTNSGGSWQNEAKIIYNYSNNKITEKIIQNWTSGAWENDSKEVSNYDANGNLQEFSELSWNSGSWVNLYNYLYQYDANGNCIVQIERNQSGGAWQNLSKYEIVYDSNNRPTEMVFSNWVGGAWKESDMASLVYNSNGDLLSVSNQYKSGGTWVNTNRWTNTYNGSQKINYLQELFDGTVWVKVQNNIYSYTPSGKLESVIAQLWDNGASSWKNEQKMSAEFNSLDLATGVYGEVWNTGGFWEKPIGSYKIRLFYESYQSTEIKNLEHVAALQLYPNPTDDILNIELTWKQPEQGTLFIYDVTGRKIMEQRINQQKTFQTKVNVSQLPAGTYYLKVATKTGQMTKAFQIM